jgi:hypothetical protein
MFYRFPKTKRVELGFGTGCRDQLIGLDSGKTKVGPEPKGSEFTLFTTPKDSEPLARGDSLDCVKRIDDTPKGGGGKPCPPRSNLISNVGERKWMFWFLPCYACFTCFCMCLIAIYTCTVEPRSMDMMMRMMHDNAAMQHHIHKAIHDCNTSVDESMQGRISPTSVAVGFAIVACYYIFCFRTKPQLNVEKYRV